ncbi:hypothetical protein Tco_1109826 [Tanacetum coccineum]|uniref:Uncharacterized protein n=1 Tax=Tanacetum coccineum TaxID=301880 RepID=A0ABQ5IJH6_9ASTR
MAKPIINKSMEKAHSESYLSITSNDIKIILNKEFVEELQKNTYHGWIEEDVIDHIAKVLKIIDLIRVPDSYDGEDEMLDEGDNWGIDLLEFLSQSDTEKEEEQSQTKRKYNNTSSTTDEQPNKRRCKEEKFEAIQYSLGPNEEYIAIRSYEYGPREGNIDEYWWRIYKSGNFEVLES